MRMKKIINEPLGEADGQQVSLFTLVGDGGLKAQITNFGGTIVRLLAPNRDGEPGDVTLGFSDLDSYRSSAAYLGALIGRYGNRIGNGRFEVGAETYRLANNDVQGGVPCHLHGGTVGFDKVVWSAAIPEESGSPALRLTYRSIDGEEGYPGNLDVSVTYRLTGDSGLRIDYTAETDAPTPVNLTNHAYFNLRGEGYGDILAHTLRMDADNITPVNADMIPTGAMMPVAGTPFDFTRPRPIGERIEDPDEQIGFGGGYDHNYVLNGNREIGGPTFAAEVTEPYSGRRMIVLTTEPGIQFYTGNFLDGSETGKSGIPHARRSGFCLEAQHFPDSPNKPQFPSTILLPGDRYYSVTEYRFSTIPS